MTRVAAKTMVTPEPVSVRRFASDGSEQGSVNFAPGPVSNFPNVALLKEAVRRQQGRLRRGTSKTRTRAEVNGTSRKPWRQKGTGRARAGTKKSPIWRGGGTVFGPSPRSYDYQLPRKQRRLAVRHALLSKLLDGEAVVIDSLPGSEPNARKFSQVLDKIGTGRACLIGIADDTDRGEVRNLVLSCRNLPRVELLPVKDFNVLSLLRNRSLVLTQSAFEQVQGREREVADESAGKAQGGSA